MKTNLITIILAFVLAAATVGCGQPQIQAVNPQDLVEKCNSMGDGQGSGWPQCESEWANLFADSFFVEKLNPQELAITMAALNEGTLKIQPAVFDLEVGLRNSINSAGAVSVPVIQVSQQGAAAFGQAMNLVSNSSGTIEYVWTEVLFHSTNHLGVTGVNIYNLAEVGATLKAIFSSALNGGIVAYRQAGGGYQEAYIFIGKLNGRLWAFICSPNGAPITAYDTAKKTVDAAMSWVSGRGWTVIKSEGELSSGIRTNWLQGTPPVLRYWWWALSYNAAQLAFRTSMSIGAVLSGIAQFASGAESFFFLIWIDPCEDSVETLCFAKGALNLKKEN
ncbi:hypothetical protein A3K34_01600 [candidate division WWE3 bacterium RIFOXYC1_FULL_40_10]|uniref:Uncharacterized protein n=1 Tax=candidate division WWE3 bacterium RIFOXYA2_FULL_46_9 TaxID=1802636 RepID=A0A1F4W2G7_UNCKA|nr:MAG: hypothetical protein A3K58_01600 [candidate division WWE3 bacterium RIFOXYB1_FULL_40_22]OGC61560.1 MAG: hypothetical protein A3K37_01600 [candidate division WWE3 bacterium RIFOXYA1_FULL_40_11]OGC63606.1 MAG: hypothetical protein A2264_04540 [candidate division WWE3 bacterium RIFOXYA2_FULL_46_9]OGC64761.1 MAG: hypothetical protein A2326_01855 [candidate division WWE3 bacterium RIFOXYB2_FULL_41_6]OGC65943.1 MAG: hypothetical protein A3K34_01600 [candidate division WWE3 bacterium RIFOXYC1_